jgi:hypothetical protein
LPDKQIIDLSKRFANVKKRRNTCGAGLRGIFNAEVGGVIIAILTRFAGGFRWGLAAALLFAASLPAQQFRATVTGIVTDPSGAAVPKGEGRRGVCGMRWKDRIPRFLDFSGRATTVPYGGENGSRRKECKSQDLRMAAECIPKRTRESKMEIPA